MTPAVNPFPFSNVGTATSMLYPILTADSIGRKENIMAKTAMVTGGARGIGRSIARRLASDGLSVVVNYAGSVKDAEETVSTIKSAGGHAVAIRGDVWQANDVNELFAKAAQAIGPIEVVVNSAGIMPVSPIAKSDVGSFDKVIAINLRGAFLVLAQAAQHVIEGGHSGDVHE
jgi:3-oxoacyl-[acyl-carrier protein] reductase